MDVDYQVDLLLKMHNTDIVHAVDVIECIEAMAACDPLIDRFNETERKTASCLITRFSQELRKAWDKIPEATTPKDGES